MQDRSHNLFLVEDPEASGNGTSESEETMTKEAGEDMGGEDRPTSDAFGPWLRRQREIRQIELHEIADRTKISVRYLKAMEQDRFELLPGAVFTRGFLREYARYVGLNPDEVVNFYLSTQEEEPEDAEPEMERPESSGSPVLRIVLGLVLLGALLLLGWLVVRYVPSFSAPAEPAAPGTEAPPGTTAEPAAPADAPPVVDREPPETANRQAAPAETREEVATDVPEPPLEITVDFQEDCWIEARIDGDRILSQRFAQGESVQIPAQEEVEFLTLGNAGGVRLRVNGVPYPLEASSGEVLRNLTLDLETARRLEERES